MEDRIRVVVIDRGSPESGDRKNLYMRYRCPLTGKSIERSTGVPRGATWPNKPTAKRLREADQVAGKWAKELEDNPAALRAGRNLRITWREFRERHDTEYLASLATKTELEYVATFNALESILPILRAGKLHDLTAARISAFQRELRNRGLVDDTIKKHLTNIGAALNWAVKMKLLREAPEIVKPKRARGQKLMKGRPITAEEFERMLAKVPRVVLTRPGEVRDRIAAELETARAKRVGTVPRLARELADCEDRCRRIAASWEQLLRGLWWSGLRLGEAMNLKWTDDGLLCVDFSGRRPMFRIHAEGQKSGKDVLLPMTPDFAEFLEATPAGERAGFVFDPIAQRKQIARMRPDSVSKVITAIGEAAKVKVNETAAGKVKFASAHDLRRAFGVRWAARVMPADLKELMRHESIETTMKFYVGSQAETIADRIWNWGGDSSGDTPQKQPLESQPAPASRNAKSVR